MRTIVLDVPDWPGHRAGQHLDVRLTAEDGYRAEREYSIASAPGRAGRDHGRAARRRRGLPVPHRRAAAGRRPRAARPGRRLLRLGGRGRRPAAARRRRLRRRTAAGDPPAPRSDGQRRCRRLLYSSRSLEDVIYRAELDEPRDGVEVVHTLDPPRSRPAGRGTRRPRRRRAARRGRLAGGREPARVRLRADQLRRDGRRRRSSQLGYRPERIKTERFGSTGGG